MCIICDKPIGVEMPSDDEIKYMFSHNPNGAGFAIQGWFEHKVFDKKKKKEITRRTFEVHYHKGFMNVDDLIEALGPKDKLKKYRVVIHCRITTSGKSDQPTTHPFPLSTNYGELRKTEGDGPVLFHNGVFQGLGGVIDKQSSDTQDFVVGVACRHLAVPNHISAMSKVIAKKMAGECRVLVLYPNPNHPDFRLGTWHDYKGIHYSNLQYPTEQKITAQNSRSTQYQHSLSYYGYGYDYDEDEEEEKYYSLILEDLVEEEEEQKQMKKYYSRKDSSHDFDEYGCNHSQFAWPEKWCYWIDLKTQDRVDKMKTYARRKSITNIGDTLYYFAYDPNKAWIIDEKTKQMYTEEGERMMREKADIEEELLNELWEENVHYFSTIDEIQEFLEDGHRTSQNTVLYEGEEWYIDWVQQAAYTDKGLSLVYKPGQIGHVRNALKNRGLDDYTGINKDKIIKKV